MNILVADDNPVSLGFFAEALASLGVACTLARDGLEAVERARSTRFDVLLLDARMPGLDGAQALARIRADGGPARDAVALATSAEAGAETRARLLEAGFVELVEKPIALGALRAVLSRYGSLDSRAASVPTPSEDALDDVRALAAAGGNAAIVTALRGLLIAELDALPSELEAMASNTAALRDRLHRIDASAGFCGAPALTRAGARLRARLEDAQWPADAIAEFVAECAEVRKRLAASIS